MKGILAALILIGAVAPDGHAHAKSETSMRSPDMRRLLRVSTLMLLPNVASALEVKAKHKVELEDAEGDVQADHDGEPGADVVRLAISSDGKELHVTVTLKEDITYYRKGRKAGVVVALNVDTDNDASTGGQTFWGNKHGFEYEVEVEACIAYMAGQLWCVGGLGDSPIKGYFSRFNVWKYEHGSNARNNISPIISDSTQTTIEGKSVETAIPYSELGLASGQTIRIAIRESDSSYDEKSFFPEVVLELK